MEFVTALVLSLNRVTLPRQLVAWARPTMRLPTISS
jgi:hypothetical protein